MKNWHASCYKAAMKLPYHLAAVVALLVIGFTASLPVRAGDWDVVLSGRSVHLNAERNWNESNWGLGVEREFDAHERWVKVAGGDVFEDSRYKTSYMAGAGIKRRIWFGAERFYTDFGVVGFLMTRDDVKNGHVFPGALPTFSVGTRRFAMNVTYMPAGIVPHPADPALRGVLFFQFKLDTELLGFGQQRIRVAEASE
jgi:Antimicrobial peptide resistance and lipid A acylation protein PagP